MTQIHNIRPKGIEPHIDKQEARFAEMGTLNRVFKKSALEPKPKLLKCKNLVDMVIFNVRRLNTINQVTELTIFAAE